MNYYFKLQYTRLKRWLKNMGINPLFGVLLGLVIFIALSKILFFKIDYANWIYGIVGLSLIFRLSGGQRNNMLGNTFSRKDYLLLRIIENSLVAIPFQVYLLFESDFFVALLLIPAVIVLAFFRTNRYWNKTIPTPFKKFPFEFIVGFRKTFWLIALAYFLIGKAIQVDNFNLGLFGLVLIFLTSMSFYQKPEPEYFVWIHSHRSRHFLKRKFVIAVICVSILSVLALGVMVVGFPESWLTTGLVYLGGYIFLGSMIVAKYSAYPYEMNIPQGIFYALSLMFPPMLLITIWVFYSRSKKRLEPILEC